MKGKRAGAMSIPELKAAFDSLHAGTTDLLRAGKSQEETTKEFQSLWKSIFHRPVTKEAAEAYLKMKRFANGPGRNNKTRRSSRQLGGAGALSGAPLDYVTRPGVDGPYGHFPGYVSGGLSFYNQINQEGMFQECGTKDITPRVPELIGSNRVGAQAGGGPAADVPGTVWKNISSYWQGKPLPPGPAPEQKALQV